jgi:hypothetical protein
VFFPILLLTAQEAPPMPAPAPYRPAAATIMAEPVAMMLAGFDADSDGRITRAEADAGVQRSFAAADTTRAGWLGYIAFADWAERWLGDRNAVPSPFEVDRDGDNHITAQELGERMGAIFDRLDRDHDGVLTHAELLTIRATTFGGRGEREGGEREGGGRNERRRPR